MAPEPGSGCCAAAADIFDPYHMGTLPPPDAALATLGGMRTRRPIADTTRRTEGVCPRHLQAEPAYQNGQFQCSVCRRALKSRAKVHAELQRLSGWTQAVAW